MGCGLPGAAVLAGGHYACPRLRYEFALSERRGRGRWFEATLPDRTAGKDAGAPREGA
jgi:hypothetical protein